MKKIKLLAAVLGLAGMMAACGGVPNNNPNGVDTGMTKDVDTMTTTTPTDTMPTSDTARRDSIPR